jgi:tripartite-type tricarboxylate transporter receptor subunit TctC
MTMKRGWKALLWAAAILAPALAQAQDYPTKPIRLVNPFSPGGSTDLVARVLTQKFTESLGQTVIVDNKPGGGTNVGTEIVVKSPPDGYTILHATSSLAINVSLYKKRTFDPVADLTPIGLLVETVNVLAVNPSVKANNVRELIDLARANPGRLSYGSSGSGATNHLGMELFKTMAKVDITHIPYKGGGQAFNDLLGGQIQVMFNPSSSLLPHHKAGKLRVLAVGSKKRIDGLDFPTVAESGLPGFESTVWYSMFAPAGTPRPVVQRLNAEINRALKDKTVIEQFAAVGLYPIGGTPEELGALLKREIEHWARVVRDSGATAD